MRKISDINKDPFADLDAVENEESDDKESSNVSESSNSESENSDIIIAPPTKLDDNKETDEEDGEDVLTMFSKMTEMREKATAAEEMNVDSSTVIKQIDDTMAQALDTELNEASRKSREENGIKIRRHLPPASEPVFDKEMIVPTTYNPYPSDNVNKGPPEKHPPSQYYQPSFRNGAPPPQKGRLDRELDKLAKDLLHGKRTSAELVITEEKLGYSAEAITVLKHRLLTEYSQYVAEIDAGRMEDVKIRPLNIDSPLDQIQGVIAHIRDGFNKERWISTGILGIKILLMGIEAISKSLNSDTFDMENISEEFFNDNPERELRPVLGQIYHNMPGISGAISSPTTQLGLIFTDQLISAGIANARKRRARVANKRVDSVKNRYHRREELAAAFGEDSSEESDDFNDLI